MANRQDSRYDERFRESPRQTQGWENRPDDDRDRSGQWNQSEINSSRGQNAGAREAGRRDPEWERGQREYPGEREGDRGGSRARHFNQGETNSGEQFRDRPYSGASFYGEQGGYHEDRYGERGDRGYGATSTGAEWGAGDIGRHRLGSLTDSAAASAERVSAARREGERGYPGQYPERINHAGRGPKGYQRADERIREEVCELLTRNEEVDASDIEVAVHEGTVVLSGTVDNRRAKRVAEDLAQDAWGAKDVQNQIRVENGQAAGRVKPETTGGVQTAQGSSSGSVLGLNTETIRR